MQSASVALLGWNSGARGLAPPNPAQPLPRVPRRERVARAATAMVVDAARAMSLSRGRRRRLRRRQGVAADGGDVVRAIAEDEELRFHTPVHACWEKRKGSAGVEMWGGGWECCRQLCVTRC